MISIVFHLDVTSYPHHKMWGGGAIMDSLCCVLPWVCASPLMCPLYKSYTNWRIFFKLGWNVHLNKGMCKTMLPMCRLKVKVTIEGQISNNQMLDIMLCPLCKSLSNLVNMLVGIIYRPNSITSQVPQTLLNYGPWIVQNKGFRCLSQRVFIPSLSNLVNMLVGIIS